MKRIQDIQYKEEIRNMYLGIKTTTYTFSDGIGKISQSFAEEISKKLGHENVPSAFQVFFLLFVSILFTIKYRYDLQVAKE